MQKPPAVQALIASRNSTCIRNIVNQIHMSPLISPSTPPFAVHTSRLFIPSTSPLLSSASWLSLPFRASPSRSKIFSKPHWSVECLPRNARLRVVARSKLCWGEETLVFCFSLSSCFFLLVGRVFPWSMVSLIAAVSLLIISYTSGKSSSVLSWGFSESAFKLSCKFWCPFCSGVIIWEASPWYIWQSRGKQLASWWLGLKFVTFQSIEGNSLSWFAIC